VRATTDHLVQEFRRHWLIRSHRRATVVIPPGVRIGPRFHLDLPGAGELRIGEGVEFRYGTVIEMNWGSRLTIGDYTQFTYHNVLQVMLAVEIGRGCMFAPFATVVDGAHLPASETTTLHEAGYRHKALTVGEQVWVASKATVNASVGDRSVIAGSAVVVRDVPPDVLAGGIPARVLREAAASDRSELPRQDHVLEHEERP
jgi:acetyltransferase-like isoleucine patch superfamily enzyme